MARSSFVVLVIALAIALSGCIQADPDVEPAEERPPGSTTDPGLVSSADGTNGVDDAPDAPVDQPPATKEVTLAGAGRTSQGAWACTDPQGTGTCQGSEIAGNEYSVVMAWDDALVSGEVTVTWTASDPTLADMVVIASWVRADGTFLTVGTEGTSPQVLTMPDEQVGRDGHLRVSVWPTAEVVAPTGASVFVDLTRADFTVEGVFLAQTET